MSAWAIVSGELASKSVGLVWRARGWWPGMATLDIVSRHFWHSGQAKDVGIPQFRDTVPANISGELGTSG